MKTYFRNAREITHKWMHQAAPEGRCHAHISFQGASLYSYGTEIARIVKHKGKRAVLISTDGYSITTAKHQSYMSQALLPETELPRLYASCTLGGSFREAPSLIYDHECRAAKILADANATRPSMKRDRLLCDATLHIERANEIARFFGIRRKAKIDKREVKKAAESIERHKAWGKEQARLRALTDAQRAAEQAAHFEAWKKGNYTGRFDARFFPVAFRVEGEELVSSLGVRVPLQDAKIALRFLHSKRGQAWRANGETCPVGSYQINSITPDGIIAGCHRFSWDEVDRIQALLNA